MHANNLLDNSDFFDDLTGYMGPLDKTMMQMAIKPVMLKSVYGQNQELRIVLLDEPLCKNVRRNFWTELVTEKL